MLENRQAVEQIYHAFLAKLEEPRIASLIRRVKDSTSTKDLHTKGSAVILYTPWRYQPDLMMIGTNPSWFHRGMGEPKIHARTQALQNLNQVRQKVPTVNSYIEHDHEFSMKLRSYFEPFGAINLLRDCVGMNRFWIQTGSSSSIKLTDFQDKLILKELKDFCTEQTRAIVALTQPKTLWLLGKPAQECFEGWDHTLHGIEYVINSWHPCQTLHKNQQIADAENKEITRELSSRYAAVDL
jgi:hypothetical protein